MMRECCSSGSQAAAEASECVRSDADGAAVVQAGHALIGALMPEYDPVAKISIVPRGAAGGLTFFSPSEERLESGLYRCRLPSLPVACRWAACILCWPLPTLLHWEP